VFVVLYRGACYHTIMKRFSLGIFALAGLIFPVSSVQAEAIRAFDSALTITNGDDALIQERIIYDFGENLRHGIYRNIPRYQCPGSTCVQSGVAFFPPARNGQREEYSESTQRTAVQQRIGDPVVEIQGVHEYTIRYSVRHAVVESPEGQLISWNVTGHDWEVPIELSTFTLEGPVMPTGVECFVGVAGSKESSCVLSTSGTRVTATLSRPLAPNEGWTVDVRYPAGTFASALQVTPKPPIPYWLMAALCLTGLWAGIWWVLGRDARGRGTVIPEYDPPRELKPYEAEALLKADPTTVGITATILDFARQGWLTIEQKKQLIGKGFAITKTDVSPTKLDPAEKLAYELLFGEGPVFETGALTGSAARATLFARWRAAVQTRMVERGWYQFNAGHARGISIVMLFVMTIGVVLVGMRYVANEPFWLAALGAIGGFPFAYAMPRMTKEGAVLAEHLQGFKRYIRVAEKDRLAFHEAPEKTPERFSALLPYAVALGEQRAWTKVFEDVGMSPDQLQGYGSGLNALAIGTLSSSLTSSIQMAVSSPSDGGGGSSGGGGGGGGGGSW
jgi:uncharacterized membrane protein YgcG